jgi:hypothetical protein
MILENKVSQWICKRKTPSERGCHGTSQWQTSLRGILVAANFAAGFIYSPSMLNSRQIFGFPPLSLVFLSQHQRHSREKGGKSYKKTLLNWAWCLIPVISAFRRLR